MTESQKIKALQHLAQTNEITHLLNRKFKILE